jgi:uncharacterized membrane protein
MGWGWVENLGNSAADGSSIGGFVSRATNQIHASYWAHFRMNSIRRYSTDDLYGAHVRLVLAFRS